MKSMPQDGEIDLLIATDCISEGQNLQDCDYLINYDIHWNPVRIIQRFGRIDRIGSPNRAIQLVNFWPTPDLNKYINLKNRVEARMALVDIAATAEDNILQAEDLEDLIKQDLRYRDKQLLRLKMKCWIWKISTNPSHWANSRWTISASSWPPTSRPTARSWKKPLRPLRSGATTCGIQHHQARHHLLPKAAHRRHRQRSSEPAATLLPRLHPRRRRGALQLHRTQAGAGNIPSRLRGQTEPHAKLCKLFDEETAHGQDMSRYSGLLDKAVAAISVQFGRKNAGNLFTGRGGKLLSNQSAIRPRPTLTSLHGW